MLKNNIFSLHIDSTGLLRLGRSVEEIFQNFESVIQKSFIENNSTVLIPAYSYSYTNKEVYDLKNSPSKVGYATEHMRRKNEKSRTSDPLFSYVVLGDKISKDYNKISDCECFGDDSIIAEMYNKNAMICSIFSSWATTFTEMHFIEKRLEVKYRKDKMFNGLTRNFDGDEIETKVKFYCRDYDYGLRTNSARLGEDLEKDSVIKTINIDDKLQVKGVFFKDLFDYIEKKIKEDYFYLCEEVPNEGS
tara:strand:- start:477 stop:1217 length:741 start_codon:yes stop_codon:yes gene_type:complete